MNGKKAILEIANLSLGFKNDTVLTPVLNNINFKLYANEILGIVGESGSGKSITNLAILGLLPKKTARITSGKVFFNQRDILSASQEELHRIRGNKISMIFQEPMSSLNPSMQCGQQVGEILKQHTSLTKKEIKSEVIALFDQVKLPRPQQVYKAYPHEISGGQMQRVMIAMAIACKPQVLIADEPTTALDVTVQKEIILLLKNIQKQTGMSIIFISHDLSLISEIAHRVLVMYKGEVIETNTAQSIFRFPEKEYTKALIYARPRTDMRPKKLPTVADVLKGKINQTLETQEERLKKHNMLYARKPLLEICDVSKNYISKSGFFKKTQKINAVNNVTFKIYEEETLGLVGESGCGKSTLGTVLLGLQKASSGIVKYKGKDITSLSKKAFKAMRKDIQIIFQDPYSSLNPRLTVGQAITEAMRVHHLFNSSSERKQQALTLLSKVGLLPEHYNRYPHQFSGGQRQRIGIARTIALQPKFIICDESVSALDISVQAQVLNLLNTLKEEFNFTYLFISHDLAVVKFIADRLLVMKDGKIVEQGEADQVYTQPNTEYTKSLINAIPQGI